MYLQGRADGARYQAPQAARLFETSLKTRLAYTMHAMIHVRLYVGRRASRSSLRKFP